ncbi:MAG TPA: hypothetical protein VEK57_05505 [Thermoanaerobaculia bacterium]|nr:hypothetical protein [Thermoanaerobaculia bacterium]
MLLTLSCSRVLPWNDQPAADEVNLSFTLKRNIIELPTVRINNRPGRFLLGSAAPRTILDSSFAGKGPHAVQISEKETVRIHPSTMELGGVADAILGAETWGNRAISIDYRSGLVTYQKSGIHTGLMTIFSYDADPMIYVNVDGVQVAAVVDTTSPDTLILPGRTVTRGNARISIAGNDFGVVDVQYANVSRARVGNRLLSRFFITIDYGKRVVGLWRDPRIGIED